MCETYREREVLKPDPLPPDSMIRTLSRFGALLLLLVTVAACDSGDSGSDFDVTDYVGTYTGAVTTEFTVADSTVTAATPITVVVAAPSGGNAVTLRITPTGGDPITLSGTYDADGAVFSIPNSTLVMRIDGDGNVSGTGTLPFFDVTLRATMTGRVTTPRFLLTADVTVTEGTDTVPVGTMGSIRFEALRSSTPS